MPLIPLTPKSLIKLKSPSFEELRDYLINEVEKEMLKGIEKKHSSEVEIVRLNEEVLGKKRKF